MGPERDRHVAYLTRGRSLAAGALVVACVIALLAGCGSNDEPEGAETGLPAAGGGGSLAYVVPELPGNLDPLTAPNRWAEVVSRQVYEPLVAVLEAPYGSGASQPGLGLSLKPSADRTVWRVVLRSSVRFQDGSPFNASAVLANARRWTASGVGRRLLPDLFAVDAPRPNEVRFQFRRPPAGLRRALSSPRLGIVSPRAFRQRGRVERIRPSAASAGTGPFATADASAARAVLTRSPEWWGTPLGLGPALDGIEFTAISAEADRVELLASGQAQVAEALGALGQAAASADPLIRVSPAAGGFGRRASVRGLRPSGSGFGSAVPVLSGVWLTTIGG